MNKYSYTYSNISPSSFVDSIHMFLELWTMAVTILKYKRFANSSAEILINRTINCGNLLVIPLYI